MKSKLLSKPGSERSFALIFDTGDDVLPGILSFAQENRLGGSHFTAIGAFQDAVLGYFDWEKKDYKKIPVREQVEAVSLVGDIALDEKGQPKIHVHAVLGRSDGTALAGHLLAARVRPTLEVMLVETPVQLRRRHDPESGLGLIRL